jgi:hypothetical protein
MKDRNSGGRWVPKKLRSGKGTGMNRSKNPRRLVMAISITLVLTAFSVAGPAAAAEKHQNLWPEQARAPASPDRMATSPTRCR